MTSAQDAEHTVDEIEKGVRADGYELEDIPDDKAIEVQAAGNIPFRTIVGVLFKKYPKRTLIGATMIITQSFLYNGIFFTSALVFENFCHVPAATTPLHFFPFAIGNLLGPLLLGWLFDTWDRRKRIFLTYGVSGVVLAISAGLFSAGALTALTQTIFWCVSFFFASAGASSAYLTVSEIFPLELRSQAISYFFALAQIFGAIAPPLYGALVGNGKDTGPLTFGYFLGAAIVIIGGVVALIFGVDAERQSLEAVTEPLSLVKS
jgi:MFS family permease